MDFYQPDYYGKIQGVAGLSVLGWATDPNRRLVLMHVQGSSTAVRGIIGKVRMGEMITFVPLSGVYSIYGYSMQMINRMNKHIKFEVFPKAPHVMPNGDIQQMIIRREDPNLLDYLCYVVDGDEDYQFMQTLKSITDFPLHNSWVTWLRSWGAQRKLWGICNNPPLERYEKESLETLNPSRYGFQVRWMRNKREAWEDMLINEGFKFGKISLPEE